MKKTKLYCAVLVAALTVTTVVPAMAEPVENQQPTNEISLDENEDVFEGSPEKQPENPENSENQLETETEDLEGSTESEQELTDAEENENQISTFSTMARASIHGNLHQEIINGKKYFIYDDGFHLTGWYDLGGDWRFYLDPNDDGAAVTGYQMIDGKEYVFNNDGVLNKQYGTPIIDGKKYWVTGDGTIRTGWQRLGSMRLYFDPTLKYALVGIHTVEGKTYIFNSDGVVMDQAGTPIVDGKKYWVKQDGTLGTGWLNLTHWKMYFDPTTYVVAVGRTEISGKKYIFNSDGVCNAYPSTSMIDGKKYWVNADSSIETGWKTLAGMRLYFFPDTWYAAVGMTDIDGKRYYFDENGVMAIGPASVNGVLHLFKEDGTISSGGTPTVNGKKYCVSSDGTIRTGWYTLTSWVLYCNPSDNGAVAKGLTQIGDKRYYFNSDGIMVTTNQIIDGVEYRFNADGSIASIGTQSSYAMTVIRNIFYAVETGGQVYGGADYSNVSLEYSNTSTEHAITIGAGAWFATEAKRLLNLIRSTAPQTFAQLDTAGIAHDLDTANWSTYKLSGQPAKVRCISNIINSDVGRSCQDRLMDEEITSYLNEAEALGVSDLKAQAMCANFRHHGGYRAMVRVLGKTAQPYTLDNLYAACQTDTGNQVGTYRSRQRFVYNNLKNRL